MDLAYTRTVTGRISRVDSTSGTFGQQKAETGIYEYDGLDQLTRARNGFRFLLGAATRSARRPPRPDRIASLRPAPRRQ